MSVELSVLVPSHFRPRRLRWLLNALEAQTLERSRWEVLVGHDSGEETAALLREHPLAGAGVLRAAEGETGKGTPGSNRNGAFRLALAPTVVFTDDDCFPPPDWLERVLASVRANPGAVIQGPVFSDPAEQVMLRSRYPRTQQFTDVPRVWAECANIAYPRAAIETVGGLREGVLCGEDTDLALRVRELGIPYLGDPSIWTHHAVDEGGLRDALRGTLRWRYLALLIHNHPELRVQLFLGVFWRAAHFWLLLALAATPLLLAPTYMSEPVGGWGTAAALLPWLIWASCRPVRGGGIRGALRHLSELPGYALIDFVEVLVLLRASLLERTLLL
jgi:GT2 family glycosyltransferase